MTERILKVEDISAIMGCSLKKAYKIVNQPDFPKITIGRNYYIPESAFNEWITMYTGKEYIII